MGDRLLKEYEKAKNLGGMKAEMRLAILTKLSAPKASQVEDTPENIAKFESAMRELAKEFQPQGAQL
jgi:hypothetical protein